MEFINKDSELNSFIKDVLCNKENPPFLFVGAGISSESQLPSWDNFINNCVVNSFNNEISTEDLAQIHGTNRSDIWLIDAAKEQYKKSQKKSESDLIHKSLWGEDPENIKSSMLHFLIVKYAFEMNIPIFTTNYDNLLEEAATILNLKVPTYVSLRSNANVNRFCIIYLHGRLPKKKSTTDTKAIASKASYYNEFNHQSSSLLKFKELLSTKSCIFIGTSMKDDNINRSILDSKKPKSPRHYWFTKLNADNFYKRELYQDLWSFLNITPIYCKTRSYDEIKTAFRRSINHLFFKQNTASSNYSSSKETYKNIDEKIRAILNNNILKNLLNKCKGPYDFTEFDLYFDLSKNDKQITLERVWSEYATFEQFQNKITRAFSISTNIEDAYFSNMSRVPSLVKESMDSLAVHKFIRENDFQLPKNSDGNSIPPHSSDLSLYHPRAWAYVSFPIFIPQISRCGAMFVLKYMNKNNRLSEEQINFNEHFNSDIIKLSRFLSEQLNNLVGSPKNNKRRTKK